jgi:hypothetical protein
MPIASTSTAVTPQGILRSYLIKSSGLSDVGARDWVASNAQIMSSADSPLMGSGTSFVYPTGARFVTKAISLKGPNGISATHISVSLNARTNPGLTAMPRVTIKVAYDGGGSAATGRNVSVRCRLEREGCVVRSPSHSSGRSSDGQL